MVNEEDYVDEAGYLVLNPALLTGGPDAGQIIGVEEEHDAYSSTSVAITVDNEFITYTSIYRDTGKLEGHLRIFEFESTTPERPRR